MKGFNMNKVLGTIKKKSSLGGAEDTPVDLENDTPETIATRCVKQFCLPVGIASGDDVASLPPIVEAAVASPAAAAECARVIRKFLGRDYGSKPSCQYNAIMLVRILADNPGPGFTRNLDKKFVDTVKELLRTGRDGSVRYMLMETLDSFEDTKANDEGLALVIEMWRKEKAKAYKAYGGAPAAPVPPTLNAPPFVPQQAQSQASYQRSRNSKRLPEPAELASRLEEARTSAKLLEQVVACTPPPEVLSKDLIKEFADRCTTASRSIQGFMAAEDPAPDNDTMENLIDTNEQLQQALNHHHRAVLQAKKRLGLGERRSSSISSPAPDAHHPTQLQPQQQAPSALSRPVPPIPSRKPLGASANPSSGKGKANLDRYATGAVAGPSPSTSPTTTTNRERGNGGGGDDDEQNPFRDPRPAQGGDSSSAASNGPPRASFELFHPRGFGAAASSSSSAAGRTGPAELATPGDDGSDRYGATPKRSEQVYRY